MMSTKLPSAAACLLLAWVGNLPAQELVINGSFENISNTFVADGYNSMSLPPGSTVIPGWATTNAELDWISSRNPFGLATPFGSFFLDLTGYHDSFPYGGVTQVLPTIAGQAYQLSFSVGQDQQVSGFRGPVSVAATIGAVTTGTYTFAPAGSSGNEWSAFQVDFTAQYRFDNHHPHRAGGARRPISWAG